MVESVVQVKFGASGTSEVASGGQQVKGVIDQIGLAVKAVIDGMVELGGAATGSFREMRVGAQEAGESIKGVSESVVAMREAISGIGEALIAAFAVEQIAEFAKQMAETAEQTLHTAETFGLTTGEVQRLKAEATLLGVPFDAITTAMQRSDRALTTAREGSKQAAEAFKVLGINIHEPMDQATLLQRELTGLSGIEDIPTRIGLAMQLFGRNIQAVAPMISVTKEQLADYNATITASGAVSDDAEAKGVALADAQNKLGVAMQGLGNALTTALAPALTQIVNALTDLVTGFTQSYNSGGLAKQAMDGLAVTLKVVIGVVELLVAAIVEFGEVTTAVVAIAVGAFRLLNDAIASIVTQVVDHIVEAFDVAAAATTGSAVEMQAAMARGFDQMQSDAAQATAQMTQDANDVATAWVNAGAAIANTNKGLTANLGKLMNPDNNPGAALGLGLQGRADTTRPPSLATGKQPKGDEDKKQVEEWAKQQEDADLLVKESTGDFNQSMLSADLAFWQAKLASATQGSALWYDILAKMAPLAARQVEQEVSEITKGTDEEIRQHERLTAANKQQAEEQVRDIRDAVDEEVKAHKEAVERMAAAFKQFSSVVDPMVHSFSTGILEMIEGTKTFQQVMLQIGQQILQDFISKVIDPMIEQWLWKESRQVIASITGAAEKTAAAEAGAAASTLASEAGNREQITSDANLAAANVYAQVSAWPVIGPFAAPILAAGAWAAVEAFAAQGFDVPADSSPVTRLHPREMVLPAGIADSVRNMASGGGGGAAGPGETSFHYHGAPTPPDAPFQQQLRGHVSDIYEMVRDGFRSGALRPA